MMIATSFGAEEARIGLGSLLPAAHTLAYKVPPEGLEPSTR